MRPGSAGLSWPYVRQLGSTMGACLAQVGCVAVGVTVWLAVRTWAQVILRRSRQLQAGFVVSGGWPRSE